MATRRKTSAGAARAREREQALAAAAGVALPKRADVTVIGGGASGLACAITAAEAGASVVVLERDLACGRTILATGNGRCNFANAELDPARYRNPEFVSAVMGDPAAALEGILGFFAGCGLVWAEEEGRLYPRSRQAASVRNVLLARAARAGVTFAPAREVTSLKHHTASWRVRFDQAWDGCSASFDAGAVVVASGGGSALVRGLGVSVADESPVLCALAAVGPAPSLLDALDGRRARCVASLTRGGRVVFREAGEVLFRPYGLSGIVSFDLSRRAHLGDMVELDLAPDVGAWEVDTLVASHSGEATALDGILDPVIAAELIALAGGPGADGLAWRVAPLVKGLPFRVTGLADEAHAQVTRGGIDISALSADTLAIAGASGLFACGEAIDVDADCGGFNLAWAWSSGLRVGDAAAEAGIAVRPSVGEAEKGIDAVVPAGSRASRSSSSKAKGSSAC
ncbi:MAG: aminoacetone oxidase family FAD-binding enzyme [Parolsenella sp.]|uniref:aminoacetone oxidase family FAD-binding enzyme n=1 Tax=Parolsenella sp. TaxID=2083006 RepID=UPI002E76DF9A|nr:aminoacetone oxidase family FAD-binding enzyme [Parolsenella sp.]MEE1372316.1 aminoacetone oxidase family FAD-binding enzyme [Parolsenella sp.]